MSANGRLRDDELSAIPSGRLARADGCADSWNAMCAESSRLGVELRPTGSKSSYRTFAQQQELYALYRRGGPLAAVPGTSAHGDERAVDLANSTMWQMVARIGARYGWQKQWSDAPTEPWHHRHRAGVWKGPATPPKPTPAASQAAGDRASGMRFFESNMAPKGFHS